MTPQQAVKPPRQLTDYCELPYQLKDDTLGEISEAAAFNAEKLIDCRKRHEKLSNWITAK